MRALLPRTKIAAVVALSGFLCLFSLPPVLGQATTAQTTAQQPTPSENSGQQTPAPNKNSVHSSAAPKNAKARPNSRTKNSKSPHQVAPTASAASAPAVPGVNDFAPGKVVISNGGAKEIRLQLTPTTTPEEASLQRRQTRNLLLITNENLKRIAGHDLDANQQDMLEQVHNYMTQARAADKVGELQRAQILASKARQLSDDLAGVRTILKLWPW